VRVYKKRTEAVGQGEQVYSISALKHSTKSAERIAERGQWSGQV